MRVFTCKSPAPGKIVEVFLYARECICAGCDHFVLMGVLCLLDISLSLVVSTFACLYNSDIVITVFVPVERVGSLPLASVKCILQAALMLAHHSSMAFPSVRCPACFFNHGRSNRESLHQAPMSRRNAPCLLRRVIILI